MDSAGIRALTRVMELRSGKSLVVQPSRQVFKLLQLVALTDGVSPDVEILGTTRLAASCRATWLIEVGRVSGTRSG